MQHFKFFRSYHFAEVPQCPDALVPIKDRVTGTHVLETEHPYKYHICGVGMHRFLRLKLLNPPKSEVLNY